MSFMHSVILLSTSESYFVNSQVLSGKYQAKVNSQVLSLLSVKRHRADGCYDHNHTQSDRNKQHDDMLGTIQQGLLSICFIVIIVPSSTRLCLTHSSHYGRTLPRSVFIVDCSIYCVLQNKLSQLNEHYDNKCSAYG